MKLSMRIRINVFFKLKITYIFTFLVIFLSFISNAQQLVPAPGPRDSPCLAAYGNRVYVFGGTGNDAQNSWFSYVEAPFNTQNLNWVALPTTGSHNASSRPACGVTSAGVLIVTGGGVVNDPNYSGIQAFDLTKGTSGTWYTPKTTGLDTVKYLTYRNSHRLVIFTTSAGEEVLFQFGGSPSNDTYLLHISNMTWETIPLDSTTPPPNGLFGIAYSKDNVYIVGGSSDFNGGLFSDIWGFNVPTRKWFDPKSSMPTGWFDGHIGHLNDTFYIVSSDNIALSSAMRVWTLSNSSFYTFSSGPMTTVSHEYYSSTQLPGSDALLTYGGSTKNSSATGDVNTYLGNTADLLVFNMTQQKWTTTYNYVTNAPMDQFIGGPLAPNQEDPFLKAPVSKGNNTNSTGTSNTGTSSSTNNNNSKSNNNSSPTMLYIIIGGVVLLIILVILAFIGYRVFRKKSEENSKFYSLEKDDNLDQNSTKYNIKAYQPAQFNLSSEKNQGLPKPSFYTNSNSSNSTLTTLTGAPHTIRVHTTVNSRFKDEIFSRHKLNAMVYDQPDAVVITPSAPTGTIILQRYRLCGNSAYGGNNTIRQAIDEQTDDQVAIKFFQSFESFEREVVMLKYLRSRNVGELLALYELPSKKDWPYVIILNYYPQSMDKLIIAKLSSMDTLYIKLLVKSITQAIHYLHTHNIAHLDIKPGNFVHEKNDPTAWRLVDFEAARFVGEEYVDDCSPMYCPPEVFNAAYNKQPIIASTSMDIWSLGCIIFELYTKTPLFYSEEEAIDKLTKSFDRGELVDFPLNKIPDQQARNILSKMLAIKPSERISCEQILRSAFLNSGLDTKQLNTLHNDANDRIITAVNQNTNIILSTLQETTNLILKQIDVVVNSLTDSMDAAIPRLYVLLPGKDARSIFRPQTWGKNTFILHLLCEGLEPNNQEAHFTNHMGYEIHDPKPLLRKAGPYLSVIATIISSGIGHAFHLKSSPDICGLISDISTRPTEYFKQLTQLLDSEITYSVETRDIESTKQDPVGRMKVVQGSALRELEAFLEVNDQGREWGGLTRVVLENGRWRWVCKHCHNRLNTYEEDFHSVDDDEFGMAI
ncbi:2132_t:CDS:2 [Gigaspora margarita]|uniref:2132_t:CDS:1 n=1 Tax=Gigaspora margarita TaxID=4874 RepID=A0ABN7VBJ0_GIGMA|nr:2132_t:CDS:2 [Gigaspora margarita]